MARTDKLTYEMRMILEAPPPKLALAVLPATLAICRLEYDSAIPAWTDSSSFLSITRTAEELSIVCDQPLVPAGVKSVAGWRAFMVAGPLDFSLTGIVASISDVLAQNKIPIFVISTFDTDYILVQGTDFDAAKEALGSTFVLKV